MIWAWPSSSYYHLWLLISLTIFILILFSWPSKLENLPLALFDCCHRIYRHVTLLPLFYLSLLWHFQMKRNLKGIYTPIQAEKLSAKNIACNSSDSTQHHDFLQSLVTLNSGLLATGSRIKCLEKSDRNIRTEYQEVNL